MPKLVTKWVVYIFVNGKVLPGSCEIYFTSYKLPL